MRAQIRGNGKRVDLLACRRRKCDPRLECRHRYKLMFATIIFVAYHDDLRTQTFRTKAFNVRV